MSLRSGSASSGRSGPPSGAARPVARRSGRSPLRCAGSSRAGRVSEQSLSSCGSSSSSSRGASEPPSSAGRHAPRSRWRSLPLLAGLRLIRPFFPRCSLGSPTLLPCVVLYPPVRGSLTELAADFREHRLGLAARGTAGRQREARRADGSAPLDPGTQMLVDERGNIEGSVTGGCVEAALVRRPRGSSPARPPESATYGVSGRGGGRRRPDVRRHRARLRPRAG